VLDWRSVRSSGYFKDVFEKPLCLVGRACDGPVILAACVPRPGAAHANQRSPLRRRRTNLRRPSPRRAGDAESNSWQWISFEDAAGAARNRDPAKYRATSTRTRLWRSRPNATARRVPTRGRRRPDHRNRVVTLADCGQESRSQQFIELLAAGCATPSRPESAHRPGGRRRRMILPGRRTCWRRRADSRRQRGGRALRPRDAVLVQTASQREHARDAIRLNGLIAAPPTARTCRSPSSYTAVTQRLQLLRRHDESCLALTRKRSITEVRLSGGSTGGARYVAVSINANPRM